MNHRYIFFVKGKKEVVAAGHKFDFIIGADRQFDSADGNNSRRKDEPADRSRRGYLLRNALKTSAKEPLTPSAGRPVATSVIQGPSWDSWWSSSDSRGQDGKIGTRHEFMTFSQFVAFAYKRRRV